MSWDPEEWLPLIKDGEFRDWLVKRPSEKDLMRARRVTKEQIIKLEDVWKTNAQAKLEDLEKNSDEDDITHILPCYEDGFQYQNIFAPLVKMAADEDKILKENQTQEGLNLEKWDRSLNKKHVAVFRPTSSDGGEIRIVPGDELVLRRLMGNGELWESKGVVKIVHNGAVHVQMNSKHCPTEHLNRFSLEFVWKSVSFDRMQDALRRFALDDESVSQYIFHQLLGHQVVPQTLNFPMPKRFSAPGLPELNHSQAQAVKSVLQMPMALIQGPPGTGKTVTSASILYHIAKQLQKSSQSSRNSTRNNRRTIRGGRNNNDTLEQILVCAPSNVAVEQLTAKIHRTGLRVVRVAARSRENVESNVEDLCLHNMVRKCVYVLR
jgi:regulator of nonsense transcripts 1